MKVWAVVIETPYEPAQIFAFNTKQGAINKVKDYFTQGILDLISDYKCMKDEDLLDFICEDIITAKIEIVDDKHIFIYNENDTISIEEIEIAP